MQRLLKTIIITLALCLPTVVLAQSSGDKLYNEGLALQKTQTIQAQKGAIAKFSSAKKLYDSAAKKKQCDNAIAVSQNIIATLSKGGGGGAAVGGKGRNAKGQKQTKEPVAPAKHLSLSHTSLTMDKDGQSGLVNVDTNDGTWIVEAIGDGSGEVFATVRKKSDTQFEVTCSNNPSTSVRKQTIIVKTQSQEKRLTVTQEGKPVMLSVEKTLVEFKLKGGDKTIDVYCNSDETINGNNMQNWRVIEKPEWCEVLFEVKKEKGKALQLLDKGVDFVTSKSKVADDPSMKTTCMKIVVMGLAKNSPEAATGLKGEIIIGAGQQRAKVMVIQKK